VKNCKSRNVNSGAELATQILQGLQICGRHAGHPKISIDVRSA